MLRIGKLLFTGDLKFDMFHLNEKGGWFTIWTHYISWIVNTVKWEDGGEEVLVSKGLFPLFLNADLWDEV